MAYLVEASGGIDSETAKILTGSGRLPTLWQSVTTVRIQSGFVAVDEDNAETVEFTADKDAVITASGAGGLDTGAEAASTFYHLWAIWKSSDGTHAAMLSTSSTSPTMPSGYDRKELLHAIFNNSSSDIAECTAIPVGDRWRVTSKPDTFRLSTATPATSVTALDMTGYIPETAVATTLNITLSAGAGAQAVDLFRDSSTASGLWLSGNYADGAVTAWEAPDVPVNAALEIAYKASSASRTVTIWSRQWLE